MKKGKKNTKRQPTEKISINVAGIQSVNGNSLISFLENTRTFEMMKFMTTAKINNIKNEKLKEKLEEIINNEDLLLNNILDTVNNDKYYSNLLDTLEFLSKESKTMAKLYKRVKKNPLNFKTKSKVVLEDLQKCVLL